MNSVGHHLQAVSSQKVLACSRREIRPRILSNLQKRYLGFPRPGPSLAFSAPRINFSCQAAVVDPDDYEDDTGYDSDDYEVLETAAKAPRTASHGPSLAPSAASSSYSHSSSSGSSSNSSSTRSTRQAIKSGFNIFLLFGAAIDRFVSRIQAAGIAASLALLAVLKRGLRAGSHQASTATLKAQRSFRSSPAGRKVERWTSKVNELQQELPEDMWGKLLWLWDRPPVQRIRLTISMANLSIRLPALLALVATQVGLLASQVSLPMLAPLLLGTGMLLRSIKTNASFLLPRIGLLVVMMWMLWFINSVVHNTVAYLRKQGALDQRLAGGIITVSECSTLLVAMIVVLSMLGVNVSALLLPAGIAVAVAAKDISHNFLAGLFLFVVQPFKLGDRLSVASTTPGVGGPQGGWFEGVCEKVDLRYVILRQGRRRLMVPSSAFITREFLVMDDGPVSLGEMPGPPMRSTADGPMGQQQQQQQQQYIAQPYLTNDYRHVWQYVEGPPLHQELQQVNGINSSAFAQSAPPPPPPPPSMQPSMHEGEKQENGEASSVSSNSAAPAAMNGAAAGPSTTASPSSAPAPPSYQYYTTNTQGEVVPYNVVQQPTSTHSVNTTATSNGSSNSTIMNMNANTGGAPAGYWQQQRYYTYGPPPTNYQYGGPWSHPLSPESWQQSSQDDSLNGRHNPLDSKELNKF